MPNNPNDAPCPHCGRTGATKRRCLQCNLVWCSKCRTGSPIDTCACPSCGSVESDGYWRQAPVADSEGKLPQD